MRGADVLVCHPGRQHSHQLALALHERGRLAAYLSGIPAWRQRTPSMPGARVRTWPIAPISRRLSAPLGGDRAVCGEYWGYRAFDRWCASRIHRIGARAVVAYENAALETFHAARAAGVHRILDAASVHHRMQDACRPPAESAELHRRITSAKDAELAMAEVVLVCSDLAARSYLAAGVPADRVRVVRLGVDTQLFRPAPGSRTEASFRFAFVGAARPLKGFDLLLRAFAAVRERHPGTALSVFGHTGDYSGAAAVMAHGQLTHERLARELAGCDCLVLPSRFDSFGLVVLEAMACGVPVIVSDQVGAAECVSEGKDGWIVPAGDVSALAHAMSRCVERRSELPGFGAAARHTAEQHDWATYRDRVARLVESLAS